MDEERTYTAFIGETLIASGAIEAVHPILKARFDQNKSTLFFIFEDQSGRQVDFDLTRALPARPRTGPGRPKLGVVSREVSLLPRHWAWLEEQPNGASAAIRRLVDQARRHEPDQQRARLATEAVGRFMSAMAGNLAGYEEASRALYAAGRARLEEVILPWPQDIRAYIQGRIANPPHSRKSPATH